MLTRPDLPVDRRTFGEWVVRYNAQLLDWYEANYGNRDPSLHQWTTFALAVYGAQIADEWSFAKALA